MLEERPRDPYELAKEVDKQETVMMDAMPSTIAHSNLPVVQQISGPSSDPFPAPEESHCCPNPSVLFVAKYDSSNNIQYHWLFGRFIQFNG